MNDDEPELTPCPLCMCPGLPARAADGHALFWHPGRAFACRLGDVDTEGEQRDRG